MARSHKRGESIMKMFGLPFLTAGFVTGVVRADHPRVLVTPRKVGETQQPVKDVALDLKTSPSGDRSTWPRVRCRLDKNRD
jgi:hypothetical protein